TRAFLHDPVGEHVDGDGFDVVRRRVVAAVDERVGAGGAGQVDRPARAYAGDQALVVAGAVGDLDDVARDRVVHADLVDAVAEAVDVVGGEHRLEGFHRIGAAAGADDLALLLGRGIAHAE